jgi:hypothetical protein
MPFSWFRIPRETSEKLKQCRGTDLSDAKFEQCVTQIVASHDGRVDRFRHVGQGRFSVAHIDWPDENAKRAITRDLDATEVDDSGRERGGNGPAAGRPG